MFKILLVNSKRLEEKFDKTNEENKQNFRKLMKTMDDGFKKVAKTMDRCLKNMNKTLETTSEGRKETEIREDQNAEPSENKNRRDKEKIQTIEENIQRIRKIWRKKIVNTKEEMEMRKEDVYKRQGK